MLLLTSRANTEASEAVTQGPRDPLKDARQSGSGTTTPITMSRAWTPSRWRTHESSGCPSGPARPSDAPQSPILSPPCAPGPGPGSYRLPRLPLRPQHHLLKTLHERLATLTFSASGALKPQPRSLRCAHVMVSACLPYVPPCIHDAPGRQTARTQ